MSLTLLMVARNACARSRLIFCAIETSQRHIILDIDKHANDIYEEVHKWGMSQSRKADKLRTEVRTLKERGFYKGFVLHFSYTMTYRLIIAKLQIRDILPGDIYLREHLVFSDCLGPPPVFSDYNADVDNSNMPKIVRVYRRPNEQDVMKQFHTDVDRLTNLKHQSIAQVFGVCRSPNFTAIILHGTTRHSIFNHCASLTAIQSLHFYIQLFNDLKSTSDYLACISTNEAELCSQDSHFDTV
ncbi:hypothetical protein ARMGADRAFT_671679 [Armillaria gallica]|uniref:Uncharacterized protein n=1 Tax=Armillaria gallica TaxID=47427 RepID=A0A2H3D383_ARMGA|nr:hypothetical protein ARMGADRAFT_671679 [Armillaria gallica]